MSARPHLVDRLAEAARTGQPFPRLTVDDRAHLAGCDVCRQAGAALLRQAIDPAEAVDRLLQAWERQGLLEEPPSYPQFDLGFLPGTALEPSGTVAPVRAATWAAAEIPGQVGRAVRELAGDLTLGVKVFRRGLQVAFEQLPEWFAPNAGLQLSMAGQTARGERTAAPDLAALKLDDPEGNLSILLTVQATGRGRSLVRVRVVELTTERPLERVLVSMSRPGAKDAAETRDGAVTFQGVDPSEYTVELRLLVGEQAGQIWRFPLKLSVADSA